MKKQITCALLALVCSLTAGAFDLSSVSHLYLVGNAVATEWDRLEAPELDCLAPGLFAWSGTLNEGEFKFVVNRGTWDSVVADSPDKSVRLLAPMALCTNGDGEDHDFKWKIGKKGDYTLIVDLNDATLTATAFEMEKAEMLPAEDIGGFRFKYCEELDYGSFIITATDGVITRYVLMTGDNHYKYTDNLAYATVFPILSNSQPTQIMIDAFDKTVDCRVFTPWDQLYMVGSFNDWAFNVPLTPSADSPYEYVWNGYLSDDKGSEIKFVGADTYDEAFNDRHLHPFTDREAFTEASHFTLGGPDRKWKVDEPGDYTVVVNLFKQTAKVTNNSGITAPDTKAGRPVIKSAGGVLTVATAEPATIAVYNCSGLCVASTAGTSLESQIPAGIYVVTVDGAAYKVAVRN